MHRQGNNSVGKSRGDGSAVGQGAAVAKRRSMAEWNRIVDPTLNATVSEKSHQPITVVVLGDKQMVHVGAVWLRFGQDQLGSKYRKKLAVPTGCPLSGRVPAIEIGQLDEQYGGLDRIEPTVVPDHRMLVLDPLAVIARAADARPIPDRR